MPTSNGLPQAQSAHIFAFVVTELGTAELAIPPSKSNGELGGPAQQETNQRIREGRFPDESRVRGFRRMDLRLRGLSPQLGEGERCKIASSLCVYCDSDSSCDAVDEEKTSSQNFEEKDARPRGAREAPRSGPSRLPAGGPTQFASTSTLFSRFIIDIDHRRPFLSLIALAYLVLYTSSPYIHRHELAIGQSVRWFSVSSTATRIPDTS